MIVVISTSIYIVVILIVKTLIKVLFSKVCFFL